MINVEPFEAKIVRDPETKDTKRGPVCNTRIRQIDPGKPSVFLEVGTFNTDLIKTFEQLPKGTIVKLSGGLVYREWESAPKGKGKPQKRSMHSLMAETVEVVPEEAATAS